ncbi:hypothetical protein JOD24_000694 [Kroppenstedtia sanguinis]
MKLPEDYVKWIRRYEGPKCAFVGIDVNGESHDVEGFCDPESLVDEMNLIFESREEYKAHGIIIPFAIDSILSKYCFFYPQGRQEPSGVFFKPRDVDLSDIFGGNDINESLYISRTFQGFLDKLYIDIQGC